MMKVGIRLAIAIVSGVVSTGLMAELSRAEWIGQVGDSAQDPAKLQQTMAQLSAEDQVAFVAEVNAAIGKLPGSAEVKAARFLAANKAAIKSAKKSNVIKVLAEVFATVPPEFLTVINERFASELFNRDAGSERKYSDAEFTKIAQDTLKAIVDRCNTAENSAVRSTFALLMFVNASNGSPSNLAETLATQIPSEAHQEAIKNWIPAALGTERQKTYDPLLGAALAGYEPNIEVVDHITAHDMSFKLLATIAAENDESGDQSFGTRGNNDGSTDTFAQDSGSGWTDFDIQRIPHTQQAYNIQSAGESPDYVK